MTKRIMDKYMKYIKIEKNLSDNTVISYNLDLKKYLYFLESKNIELLEVRENDIYSYLIYLDKENTSLSTVSRMISSIKSLHEYLFNDRLIEKNPSLKVKKPKLEKNKVNILERDEVEKLLGAPNLNTLIGIRDKAMFEVFYGTGMRVSELVELNISDINMHLEYIQCTKNNISRTIPLGEITKKYIDFYLTTSRIQLVKDVQTKAMFVNSKGEKLTRQGLWKVIKIYSQKMNINKNITPTMLRHSFAIHMINNGADISVVSKILGNSNLSSLQGYLNYINKNVRDELKNNNPRN